MIGHVTGAGQWVAFNAVGVFGVVDVGRLFREDGLAVYPFLPGGCDSDETLEAGTNDMLAIVRLEDF